MASKKIQKSGNKLHGNIEEIVRLCLITVGHGNIKIDNFKDRIILIGGRVGKMLCNLCISPHSIIRN